MASTFHRRKAVAPLKLLDGLHRHLPRGVFPSPKGGGPIEAPCVTSAKSAGAQSFPSPKGGGPIEAARICTGTR